MSKHVPRVYVENVKTIGDQMELCGEQYNHIVGVLRLKDSSEIIVFNETIGEWIGELSISKKNASVIPTRKLRDYVKGPEVLLAFCVIKQDPLKVLIEKATELGTTQLIPLVSDFTNQNFKSEKAKKYCIGASEQCGRLDVPLIQEPKSLAVFLNELPNDVTWYSAIEHSNANVLKKTDGSVGFIIGPEGGFSEHEKELLSKTTTPISLADNILRSDTAAACVLAQYFLLRNL